MSDPSQQEDLGRDELVDAGLDRVELRDNLNRVLREVDGVTDLYDARPTALAAVTAVATRLTGRPPVEPVVVASSREGLTVSVSLAVSENLPAADTCRRVFDVVHDFVAAHAPEDTLRAVRIRVSRIG
ncbi:hypothetical protein D6T64_16860 [Cryobacterium melibiosiphilum]|uniref:Asp23/Gls24 family envelope stress response protein n=1 Tax=Cryobacterium melibiosiphilum TaxID=995039 RepID=A0A3A5MAE2_9MICO|nr:hypothetical protein [Cryobacterium melibiosiphilum]RJT87100.1 hypothetical protein D6T64_16860 [Cryobacterium melibiosiphilum]